MEFIFYSYIGYIVYFKKNHFFSKNKKKKILQKCSQQTDKEIYWYMGG